MNENKWLAKFGLTLLIISVVLFYIHFLIFNDLHHILVFGAHDVAFLPLEVLLVTLIIHQLLENRERKSRLNKLNMVIGSFYSEIGKTLLIYLSDCDPNLDKVQEQLCVGGTCSDKEFNIFSKVLKGMDYKIDITRMDLDSLKDLLTTNKDYMLRLLENPNVFEHESFTELLFATFHMTEEFKARAVLGDLPETDLIHLEGDINRVYGLLIHRWLDYMKHVKNHHPYLFSLYIRTNPFDEHASPIIKT